MLKLPYSQKPRCGMNAHPVTDLYIQKTWDRNTTEGYPSIEMNEILPFGYGGCYIKLDKSITERQISTIDFFFTQCGS